MRRRSNEAASRAEQATLEFLHDVLRVGGAAASQAWAKHERRERRWPVVILRALVVRGRAVARRGFIVHGPGSGRCASSRTLDERQSSSDDEADDRKRARVLVCNEGPFRPS